MVEMSESLMLKPGQYIRPLIDKEKAKQLIETLYCVHCLTISQLNGYDDKNYKVLANDSNTKNGNAYNSNDGFVLKIMNSLDSKKLQFVDAQNMLMLYLRQNGITCPTPIKNKHGDYYSLQKLASGDHVVRLLKFVPGTILHQISCTPNIFYKIGKFVATVDLVMKNFYHPAYDTHRNIWMLDSVLQLNQFLFAITDLSRRQLIEQVIAQFNDRVLANKCKLEEGVIHGDFNEQNIVMELTNGEWNIKGILDFGDSQRSCYIFELAITVTYAMIVSKTIDAAGYVLAGYSTVRIPTEEELSILKICVAARLSQSLVLGAYTSTQDPDNTYLLTTAVAGWELLTSLWKQSDEKVLELWRRVAKNYNDCDYGTT